MLLRFVSRWKDEEGQSIVIVALAMGIFLLGAVGLGFDGSNLYWQRQAAQLAADAAAQAAILSIFNGTNVAGAGAFVDTQGTSFTCATSATSTPCSYGRLNGFGGSTIDTVTVSFPADSAAPGVSFSSIDPTHLVQVSVSRNVPTTLMRLLGATVTTVNATAMAAIVDVNAPIPILIAHPTLPGAFATNGGILVTICGGPHRSVQVNSTSATSTTTAGGGTVDLSKAGPPDTGNCMTGTGSDFGNSGGPYSAPSFTYNGGSTGSYVSRDSQIADPLAGVSAPGVPANAGTQTSLATGLTYKGVDTCPAYAGPHGCTVLTPGLYTGSNTIDLKNTTAIFEPGIYYVSGSLGFHCKSNCNAIMGSVPDTTVALGGTGTTWDGTQAGGGILVYNTGTGTFDIGSNGSVNLIGSPSGSTYEGILFFEDHTAAAASHSLGGGGGLTLFGTLYMTASLPKGSTSTRYQTISLQGTPGSSTTIQGEIITDVLTMGGNAGITMNLSSTPAYIVREVAMVQ
jgi:Flp pilus assembly protein TadG